MIGYRHVLISGKRQITQILFQIDGDMFGDIVTNTGDVLEWIIEGVTYNQNNVPVHIFLNAGGMGECNSSDAFQGVTGFRMESCSLINTLDFRVLNKLTGQLLLGTNNFSACIFPTILSPQQITSFRVNNNDEILIIDIRSFELFPTAVEISNNPKLTNFLYTESSNNITNIPDIQNTPLLAINFDLSWIASVISSTFLCSGSGILSYISPTTSSLGTITAQVCPNITSFDISGMTGLNGNFRILGCNSLTTINYPTSHVSGSISQWLCESNPLITSHNLFNLNFNDSIIFRCYNSTSLTSLIMPNSATFKSSVQAYNCDLGYVDFTNNTSIFAANNISHLLQNNNMTATEVNHILVDLAAHVSSESAGGDYTGRSLNISGTNAAPDSTSGGFDGLTAKAILESKGITVITS